MTQPPAKMPVMPDVPPRSPRLTPRQAAVELAGRDPVLARLIEAAGPPKLRPPNETNFGALARAIVYQQLAGSAAAAIHGRLIVALEGDVSPSALLALSDEEVIERLSTVRGIGRWTAEMFLLFQLRRLDIWPTGDLGVRRGFGLAWGIPMPDARDLGPLGEPFRPYRSLVAWYCWRACELYAEQKESALTK